MKTTTATKKAYRQPQIIEIGDAVQTTLGIDGVIPDWFTGYWYWF